MKNFLYIFVLLLSFNVFGQTDSTQLVNRIFLKNISNDRTSATIKKWAEVKIWLKEDDKPVKGFISYLNDTTLLLNETIVAIDRIEKMKITRPAGKVLGTFTTVIGATVAGGGLVIMANTNNQDGLAAALYFGLGAITAIFGGATAIIGTVLLFGNSKKYDLNEWEIQFE